MPTFNNINDLAKYIGTPKGSDQILNEKNIRSVLTKEAKRLEKYLKEELNAYFSSYDPVVYERTGDTVRSIEVRTPKRIGQNQWSIEIGFNESLAMHPSYIGEDQPDGYTPWLLETGWSISGKVGFSRPMFTEHPGTQYITKAVSRFNRDNPYGLKITVYRGNDVYIG